LEKPSYASRDIKDEIGQQSIDQMPWGHIVTLIYKV